MSRIEITPGLIKKAAGLGGALKYGRGLVGQGTKAISGLAGKGGGIVGQGMTALGKQTGGKNMTQGLKGMWAGGQNYAKGAWRGAAPGVTGRQLSSAKGIGTRGANTFNQGWGDFKKGVGAYTKKNPFNLPAAAGGAGIAAGLGAGVGGAMMMGGGGGGSRRARNMSSF